MEPLHQRLGPHTMVGDLADLGMEEMQKYGPYEDELQNAETFFAFNKEQEVTPNWGDQCFKCRNNTPRGDRMARGQVVCQKHNAKGNLISRSNQNPILSTQLYEVEFPGREVIELAANIITELMYAQCDNDRNKYLLLLAFINHRKTGSALSIENQKVVVRGQERKSTDSWDICCKWKYGSTSWEKLSNLTELHPIYITCNTGHKSQASLQLVGSPNLKEKRQNSIHGEMVQCLIP